MTSLTGPPLAAGLERIEAQTRAGLVLVEEALALAVRTADAFVQEAASHLLRAGGKRFRSTLVLLSGQFGNPEDPRLIQAAVAIELTHLSTLYHDDVIDGAEMRRGTASANARFDNRIAVLTGDYLFARASGVTAELGTEATRILAAAIGRLCEGEIREVRGPLAGEDQVAHHMSVLADKTGALIGAACRLGGLLSGAPEPVVEALSGFGEDIGVAFQLADDLLDITGEATASGKLPGIDVREGVRTLPMLHLLQAGGSDAARFANLLDRARLDDQEGPQVLEALRMLRESEAVESARATALAVLERARASVGRLPAGPARTALDEVANRVLDRSV